MAKSQKAEAVQKDTITKDMQIGDIVKKYPDTAMVMMSNGMHCIGCHVSAFESIEQGAKAHGISDDVINKMVSDMNKLIKKQ
jgi:hybrid cluster-associated redox disulfide protein